MKLRIIKNLFLYTLISVTTLLNAQQLNESYHEDGLYQVAFGQYDEFKKIITDHDNLVVSIVNQGNFTDNTFDYDVNVFRQKVDGDLDSTFGNNGVLKFDFDTLDYSIGRDIIQYEDSSYYILGSGYSFNQSSKSICTIAHLTSDGQLDSTFGDNGTLYISFLATSDVSSKMHIDSKGRLIIVGSTSNIYDANHTLLPVMARYLSSGEPDTTFASTGKIHMNYPTGISSIPNAKTTHAGGGKFYDVTTDAAGNIYAGGGLSNGFYYESFMVKYTESGEVDSDFSNDGYLVENVTFGNKNYIQNLYTLNNGDIGFVIYTDVEDRNFIYGTLENDELNVTEVEYTGTVDILDEVIEAEDGDLYLIGRSIEEDNYSNTSYADYFTVVRINQNGEIDNGFGESGRWMYAWDGENDAGCHTGTLVNDSILFVGGKVYIDGVASIASGIVSLKVSDAYITAIEPELQGIGNGNIIRNFQQAIEVSVETPSTVSIYSLAGTIVYQKDIIDTYMFDMDGKGKGMYFISIQSEEKNNTVRVVKSY